MSFETFENIEFIADSNIALKSDAEIIDGFASTPSMEKISPLNNFEVDINSDVCNSKIEATEILHDCDITESIAKYLESVVQLRYENWATLSTEARIGILNRVEQTIAGIEHRPPMTVVGELMDTKTLGYQDWDNNKIAINSNYITANNPYLHRELIDTVIHEGRHAYQRYNVDVQMVHESWAEVNTWKENYYNPQYGYYHSTGQKMYIPTNYGYQETSDFRLYYYQPVETDARIFAADVMARLERDGIVIPKTN